MTTTAEEIRPHVTSLEQPLTRARHFLDAIALITEAMEEPHAGAVNIIVHTALEHVTEADDAYAALFKLSHPDRERFDREGWPGEAE
jgi:hypothetical protein